MRETSANCSNIHSEICEGFVDINGVPVSVKTWGKWVRHPLDDVHEIIVLLPGMIGGIPAFYSEMLSKLYENLNREIPIWAVGHPGHEESPTINIPPLDGNECLYDIDGQVASKAEFINKIIPPHVKVHIIGHSLGTYTTLQLLKDQHIKDKVQKCYLIFPTIRGRKDGKNSNCTNAELFIWFFEYFGFILSLLCRTPDPVKRMVFGLICWMSSVSSELINPFLKITKPSILDKIVHLIKTSVRTIRYMDPDIKVLEANKDLIKLYYGTNDGWVPLEFYRELKISIPGIDAEIDTYDIEHSMVLRSSVISAKILSEMIKSNRA